jgi:hypothetical protein
MRQILVEQIQFADQQAACRAVDRRVLRADGDADRFGMRRARSECEGEGSNRDEVR